MSASHLDLGLQTSCKDFFFYLEIGQHLIAGWSLSYNGQQYDKSKKEYTGILYNWGL